MAGGRGGRVGAAWSDVGILRDQVAFDLILPKLPQARARAMLAVVDNRFDHELHEALFCATRSIYSLRTGTFAATSSINTSAPLRLVARRAYVAKKSGVFPRQLL